MQIGPSRQRQAHIVRLSARQVVIQGLFFQSSVVSDFYKVGEVRLGDSDCTGNISRPEQEAQAPQAR